MTTKQILASIDLRLGEILEEVKKIKQPAPSSTPTPTPAPTPTTTPTPTPTPVPTTELYVAETQASRWAVANPNHPIASSIKKIAAQPTGEWLAEWSGNIFDAVKSYMTKAGDKRAVFVPYYIPGRDNGNFSAGGARTGDEYLSWIGSIASAIGQGKAIIVSEPDAIALSTDRTKLTEAQARERLEMIRISVDIYKQQPNIKVYLDASMWKDTAEMASLLKQAGIDKADGFSMNVSGFKKTADCEAYGRQLQALVNKPFIIDTSRNGNGEWDWQPANPGKAYDEVNPWCNPPGRALGNLPDLSKGYLWLKRAGESDGTCRGYPSAGTFVPELATEMAKNANY